MLKKVIKGFLFLFVLLNMAWAGANPSTKSFAERTDVQNFIQEMSTKHRLDKKELTRFFKEFRSEPKILALMSKQFEALPWHLYRERLLSQERIKAGVEFWKKHETTLKKAERQFGVPAEIIVAIIGVETFYGQKTGNYPVIQALATLAFDYPRRADFFKSELEQFLLLVHEEKLDPKTILGSYAGAMGTPQFIPSSYRRYAVDFSGTGRRDLINDTQDAIGSVANYFKENGWIPDEPIVHPAIVSGNRYQQLPETSTKNPKPNLSIQALTDYGIQLKNPKIAKSKAQMATLLILQNKDNNSENWLGFYNFYVITRYNRSVNYAMAVYQLSQKIRILKKG